MKTKFYFVLVLFLSGSILVACNNSETQSQEETHHHDAVITELTLNNGQKWKSDAATDNNVASLKKIAEIFSSNASPAISNYQALGNDLGEGLNKMISECKMSGPDHDALHLWLEPVIRETNELKTVADIVRAGQIFSSLKERIEAYQKFFEVDNNS